MHRRCSMRVHANRLTLVLVLGFLVAPILNTPTLMLTVHVAAQGQTRSQSAAREALIARAKTFELNTPYVAPPGDPVEHDASGYAKVMCSAVFITRLDPDFAAKNIGGFTSSFEERAKLGKPDIDRANKTVTIVTPSGVKRVARYLGSQGCVTLPVGKEQLNFKPVTVKSTLPDASTQAWPMGDVLPKDPLPREINAAKLKQAVDAA